MLAVNGGDVKVVPVPRMVVLVAVAYQLKAVPVEVTSNLATLSRHTPEVSVLAMGAEGAGVTVTVTAVRVEGGQPVATAST